MPGLCPYIIGRYYNNGRVFTQAKQNKQTEILLGIKETSSLCLFNHNCELAKSKEMKLAVSCHIFEILRDGRHRTTFGAGAGAGVINFRQGRSEVFFTDCDQNKRDVNANCGSQPRKTSM